MKKLIDPYDLCSICDNEYVHMDSKAIDVKVFNSGIGDFTATKYLIRKYCEECFDEYGGNLDE